MPVPEAEMKKVIAEEVRKGEPPAAEKAMMAETTLADWDKTYNEEIDRLLDERAEGGNNFTDKEISNMAEAAAVDVHKGTRPTGGRRRKSKKTRKSRKASKKSRKTRRRA